MSETDSEKQMLLENFGTICRLSEECPFSDIRIACQELYTKAAINLHWARPLPQPLPPSPVSYFFPLSHLLPLDGGELIGPQKQLFEQLYLKTGVL